MTIKCLPLLWIRALVGFLGIIDTPRLWQLAFVTVKLHNGIVFSSLGRRGKNLKDKEWNPAGMLWTASCLMWSWLHSGTLVSTLLTASPSCPLGGSICEHDAVTALTTFWGIFGWSVLKQRKVLNCSDIFFWPISGLNRRCLLINAASVHCHFLKGWSQRTVLPVDSQFRFQPVEGMPKQQSGQALWGVQRHTISPQKKSTGRLSSVYKGRKWFC